MTEWVRQHPLLVLILAGPMVIVSVALATGYPHLPWWQRLPHDLCEQAFGALLWTIVRRRR